MRQVFAASRVNALLRSIALVATLAILGACSNPESDFRTAEQQNTEAAYSEFLARHPESSQSALARERLARVVEQRDWTTAEQAGTAAAFRLYLQVHPMGLNADAALEKLLELERITAWQTAQQAGSRESLESFLRQYPDAPEAAQAREQLTALMPPPPPPPVAKPRAPKPTRIQANFHLQLGAFSTRDRADQQRKSLDAKFGKTLKGPVTIEAPKKAGKDPLYRLRSVAMPEAEARSACAALKGKGQACLVVPG